MHKANKIFFIVFKSILSILLIYNIYYLYSYKNFNQNKYLVDYTLVDVVDNSSGRGSHYSMNVLYENKPYTILITAKQYENIKNEKPNVYLYKKEMISEWSYNLHKRYIWVILVLLIGIYIASRYYIQN